MSSPHSTPIPELPYQPGFTANIAPHSPPEPYGAQSYTSPFKTYPGSKCVKDVALVKAVLQIPPRDLPLPASTVSQDVKRELQVLEIIAGGALRGAQVL